MKKKNNSSGTFTLNKDEAIHRWYSYIEGYSSSLINNELDKLSEYNFKTIYDPFGGTGTTLLAASVRGMKPYYSETNPFMSFVTSTKINSVYNLVNSNVGTTKIRKFKEDIIHWEPEYNFNEIIWDGFEKFYESEPLYSILEIKKKINNLPNDDTKKIITLALASILVECSKMLRRGDLRYARPNEKKEINSVKQIFLTKLDQIIEDIDTDGHKINEAVIALAPDSRNIDMSDSIDCVITSPPYLNGTNYIRNTKLELKLTEFVTSENDLAEFHSKGIIAGINNVSKRNTISSILPIAKPYVDLLSPITYDKRIPLMINGYFNDMDNVFAKLAKIMRNNGIFIMDIGDSQFSNIHIPTHSVLAQLCSNHGFKLYSEDILRTRRSKNGMELSQRVLRFKLNKESIND